MLNHPLWDIEMLGNLQHQILLSDFLAEHGHSINAFEINGFRSWSENKAVIEMAETLGYPLVSGGDRHCCQTNSVINVTNSKTFSEFVEEIRVDRRSEIVLLPEYRKPLVSRQISSIAQILKNYPEFSENRRNWLDRVFVDANDDSGLRPLSFHWKRGGPKWLRRSIQTLKVLNHPAAHLLYQLTVKSPDKIQGSDVKAIKPIKLIDTEALTTDLNARA